MWSPESLKRLVVVTGHYGSGKTNLAMNFVADLAAQGHKVTLVDLDIVNPYFRSSDYATALAEKGVDVIAPNLAGTTLDVPSLSAAVDGVFERTSEGYVILDVGGDDAGATALGRYRAKIADQDHDFLYVINRSRNLTHTAAEAIEVLREIEGVSGLTASGIANNTHLQDFTTLDTVVSSLGFAHEVCETTHIPLVCTTIPVALKNEADTSADLAEVGQTLYPVKRYVRTVWDENPIHTQ